MLSHILDNIMEPITWVTSDLHFFHDNIISHCNRPTTIEEHEDWIVNQLNAYIKPNDVVYHLGDFSCGRNATFKNIKRVLARLNGTWLFIVGNHDKENQLKAVCAESKCNHQVLGHYHERTHNKKLVVMFHFPIEHWNKERYGAVHLHGHLHNRSVRSADMMLYSKRFNVCFDVEHIPYRLSEFTA